jgi:hypothetical protein
MAHLLVKRRTCLSLVPKYSAACGTSSSGSGFKGAAVGSCAFIVLLLKYGATAKQWFKSMWLNRGLLLLCRCLLPDCPVYAATSEYAGAVFGALGDRCGN